MADAPPIFHSNKYTAESACEHCAGIIRHERWCITVNQFIRYCYEVVLDASKMTASDHEWLTSLGAAWADFKPCTGKCSTKQDASLSQTDNHRDR